MDDVKSFRMALMIKIRAASRQDKVGFDMIDSLMNHLWSPEIHDQGRAIGNLVVRSVKAPESVVREFDDSLGSFDRDESMWLANFVKILGVWACSGNGDRSSINPVLKREYKLVPPAYVKSTRQMVDWWFVRFGDKPDPVAELRGKMRSPYSIRHRMLQYT